MPKGDRPWRTIRVVVEVKVPPNNRSTERDLEYHVTNALEKAYDGLLPMARIVHLNHYLAVARVKLFTPFWPMFLRKEKGLRTGRPKGA